MIYPSQSRKSNTHHLTLEYNFVLALIDKYINEIYIINYISFSKHKLVLVHAIFYRNDQAYATGITFAISYFKRPRNRNLAINDLQSHY
jgi:hypothetical protein